MVSIQRIFLWLRRHCLLKMQYGCLYVFADTDTCEFIKLSKTHRWVVDNRELQIVALRILCKPGTDDMMDEMKTVGNREMKKRSAMVIINYVFFRFSTMDKRRSYECHKFKRTCYCFLKLRTRVFHCSDLNPKNPGRAYFACINLKTSIPNCSFFCMRR